MYYVLIFNSSDKSTKSIELYTKMYISSFKENNVIYSYTGDEYSYRCIRRPGYKVSFCGWDWYPTAFYNKYNFNDKSIIELGTNEPEGMKIDTASFTSTESDKINSFLNALARIDIYNTANYDKYSIKTQAIKGINSEKHLIVKIRTIEPDASDYYATKVLTYKPTPTIEILK